MRGHTTKHPIMRGLTASLGALIASCALAVSASAAPPVIVKTSFSNVGHETAILKAEINPGELKTKYRFEYGLADCATISCTKVPLPEGEIEKGNAPVLVKVKVSGLSPSTTYHFRAVAKNANGEVKGPDRTFLTLPTPSPFGPCPNDQIRKENPMAPLIEYSSANLPDCRAYEQASPVEKNGNDAKGMVLSVKASLSGDAISFVTVSGIPGAEGAQDIPTWLARKGPSGWATQGLLPSPSAGQQAPVRGWSPDFTQVFDWARRLGPPKEETFLAISTLDRSRTEIFPYLSGGGDAATNLAGSNTDGSVIAFESRSKLLPAAIAGKSNVYAWKRNGGVMRLASVLNDGTSPNAEGAFAGAYNWIGTATPALPGDSRLEFGGSAVGQYTQDQGAVSADGKDVFFTTTPGGQLYVRLNATEEQSPLDPQGKCTDKAKACTLHLSASQRSVPDPAGTRPAAFMAASADGSTAYFTSPEKLTNDAKTGPEIEPPTIARAELDGDPTQLDFLPQKAKGLVASGGFLYWASPEEDAIGRAKLNGSGAATDVEKAFITGTDNPQWVAADAEHLYWTNAGELDPEGKPQDGKGTIGRAKLNGSGAATDVEQDFIEGVSNPQGIDVNATHVYWANDGIAKGEGRLARANVTDGSNVEEFGVDGQGDPADWPARGLTLGSDHIYFTTICCVRRIPLANLSQFPSLFFIGNETMGVAWSPTHLYWTNEAASTIGRAKLGAGEAIEEAKEDFIKEAGHPLGLALDGTHLYWSANQKLVPNLGNDLYRFETETGELSDLTKGAPEANGAEVKGVLGTSSDGSYVYFVANGVLAPGAAAGDCKGFTSSSGVTFSGQCSLYLAHEDEPIAFIARLEASSDARNWIPAGPGTSVERTSRVSPDGQTLLFISSSKLSAYENEGTPELYRYRVGEAGPTCVSCAPSGAAPTGAPGFGSIALPLLFPKDEPAARLSRNLSADGNRVFFETTDALLPQDTNGVEGCPQVGAGGSGGSSFPSCLDVYEWEAKGTGSCTEGIQGGGCLYLLSSGTSSSPSFFADASLGGEMAFIITTSRLVGQDQDQLYDVYGAGVGGGLLSQNQPPPVICTSESACRPTIPAPPATDSPGTGSFVGPGNVKEKPRCPKGKRAVKAKGKTRCVAKKGKGKGKRKGKRANKSGRAGR